MDSLCVRFTSHPFSGLWGVGRLVVGGVCHLIDASVLCLGGFHYRFQLAWRCLGIIFFQPLLTLFFSFLVPMNRHQHGNLRFYPSDLRSLLVSIFVKNYFSWIILDRSHLCSQWPALFCWDVFTRLGSLGLSLMAQALKWYLQARTTTSWKS